MSEADCPDEVKLPDAFKNDNEKALWMSRDKDAGDMCRAAFHSLWKFTINPPK